MDRSRLAVVSGRSDVSGTGAAVCRSPLSRRRPDAEKRPLSADTFVAAAFSALVPKNPLRKLGGRDRELLWALLTVSSISMDEYDPKRDPVELASAAAADAGRLADRLERDLFNGPVQLALMPLLASFGGLPGMLRELSQVSHLLSVVGKPGQKGKARLNEVLVMASELVRLRTGHYYDEQTMELWQHIDPQSERAKLNQDVIRKTRERLQTSYPDLYRAAVARVESWSKE